MANIIVTGSRRVNNPNIFLAALKFHELDGIIENIYVGDADGVDKLARQYADENNITKRVFDADWKRFGKTAGNKRNIEMLECAEKDFTVYNCRVLALPCAESKGTYSCMVFAKLMGFTILPYDMHLHSMFGERWRLEKSRGFTY